MWAFLARATKEHEGGIVLLREKLERGRIVEWMDVILLGKLFR